MTQQLDVAMSVHGLAVVSAVLADLVDEIMQHGTDDGNGISLRMTPEESRRLHFFSNQVACDARRLERQLDEGESGA